MRGRHRPRFLGSDRDEGTESISEHILVSCEGRRHGRENILCLALSPGASCSVQEHVLLWGLCIRFEPTTIHLWWKGMWSQEWKRSFSPLQKTFFGFFLSQENDALLLESLRNLAHCQRICRACWCWSFDSFWGIGIHSSRLRLLGLKLHRAEVKVSCVSIFTFYSSFH